MIFYLTQKHSHFIDGTMLSDGVHKEIVVVVLAIDLEWKHRASAQMDVIKFQLNFRIFCIRTLCYIY